MNREAVREMLADGWVRTLLVVLPISIATQFAVVRPAAEIALSVMLLLSAAGWVLYTGYRRTETRLAFRRDKAEYDRMRAEMATFLATRKK